MDNDHNQDHDTEEQPPIAPPFPPAEAAPKNEPAKSVEPAKAAEPTDADGAIAEATMTIADLQKLFERAQHRTYSAHVYKAQQHVIEAAKALAAEKAEQQKAAEEAAKAEVPANA